MPRDLLVPQRQIEDIAGELLLLPIVASERAEEHKSGKPEKLTEKQLKSVRSKLAKCEKPFELDMGGIDFYRFKQDKDLITVNYTAYYPLDASEIEINQQGIDTPFLSGMWYGVVKQFDFKVQRNSITITLQVNEEMWPVLVCGGDLDTNSAFLLSAFCSMNQLTVESNTLLYYSAKRGNVAAMISTASRLFESDPNKSLYWIAESGMVLNSPSLAKIAAIACTDLGRNEAQIAENIFILLAKSGDVDSFYYLGYLHMKHSGDFDDSDELAIQYLSYAANNFNHLKSMDTLGKCYLNGICVEKNEEEGRRLLKMAGELALRTLRELSNEETEEQNPKPELEKNKEETEGKNNKRIIATAVFGGAFLIGCAAAAIFFFQKRRN